MDEIAQRPRYVVYMPLPRALELRLEDAFLERIGATRPAMGYHLSLVGPFTLLAEPWQGDERLVTLCAAVAPFSVHLEKPDLFRAPNANTLMLPVSASAELVALQSVLYAALLPWVRLEHDQSPAAYRPHITLGIGLLDTDLADALRGGDTPWNGESFWASEVCVARQHRRGPWEVLRRMALGQSAGLAAPESSE